MQAIRKLFRFPFVKFSVMKGIKELFSFPVPVAAICVVENDLFLSHHSAKSHYFVGRLSLRRQPNTVAKKIHLFFNREDAYTQMNS